MTHIKVENKHVNDPRWLDAGADAFAVHLAVMAYCDLQLSDGSISHGMACRVTLAVPPERVVAAIAVLVESNFLGR